MFKFIEKIFNSSTNSGQRVSGRPTSSNQASSLHLYWELPNVKIREASANFEVLQPPQVPELYFWALQTDFVAGSTDKGGAHFGLQHHTTYPENCAVNWGGYNNNGQILSGTSCSLGSAAGNDNTHNYKWKPNHQYQYRIYRHKENWWRGSIVDVATKSETVVRDLEVHADAMVRPIVWTESFAKCDDPPVSVRWSNLKVVTVDGEEHSATSVRVNYQSEADGGCSNTSSSSDSHGFVQTTGTNRTTPQEAVLSLTKQ